jgi:hypothetical protein
MTPGEVADRVTLLSGLLATMLFVEPPVLRAFVAGVLCTVSVLLPAFARSWGAQ